MAFVDNLHVDRFKLIVTFGVSIRAASISTGDFKLLTNDATPVELAGFEVVVPSDDYDSIRRRLTLHFADLPNSTGNYILRIDGLVNAAGATVGSQDILFTYPFDNTDIEQPVEDPPASSTEIEDRSIRIDAFVTTDYVSNVEFYLVSTDPDNDSVFVEPDYNDGRITATFSAEPALNYVNDRYFRVQRKKIQLEYSRWEEVLDTKVVADSTEPKVYVSLPSLSATPVYDQEGFTYYEDGYKYRLKIHPEVSTISA